MKNQHGSLEVLIDEENLRNAVETLAKSVNAKFPSGELIVIAILKGSFIFASDLVRRLTADVRIEFMEVSSYGNELVSSGQIKIIKDLSENISGKDVIIVEDIVDSGFTMAHLKGILNKRGARTIKVCTLLNKPSRRVNGFTPDYIGFNIEDHFVVGYGMDAAEKYRALPYIAVYHEREG